jgi:hypothetical protein
LAAAGRTQQPALYEQCRPPWARRNDGDEIGKPKGLLASRKKPVLQHRLDSQGKRMDAIALSRSWSGHSSTHGACATNFPCDRVNLYGLDEGQRHRSIFLLFLEKMRTLLQSRLFFQFNKALIV